MASFGLCKLRSSSAMSAKAASQEMGSYLSAPAARTIGSVSLPCCPSQYSLWVSRSANVHSAKNSRPTRRSVASSATALAPFSQNSATAR